MSCDGVKVTANGVPLGASLEVPGAARGLVLFSHGSGRHSPRNRRVARVLQARGFATLLVDLLTPEEAQIITADAGLGFDVEFLAERLTGVTAWARRDPRTAELMPCYFGAGIAAAVALIAAARRTTEIGAVVSRGGRLDLAARYLPDVRAPTLLIVGAEDATTLALSRSVLERITCAHRLAVVPGATHLFSEPGALDEVAHLTAGWFLDHVDCPVARPARDEVTTTPTIANYPRQP
jgi:alpha-beta hydrolase superfamily lysophospholipase